MTLLVPKRHFQAWGGGLTLEQSYLGPDQFMQTTCKACSYNKMYFLVRHVLYKYVRNAYFFSFIDINRDLHAPCLRMRPLLIDRESLKRCLLDSSILYLQP